VDVATILFIGLGLAMDCLSVSITSGLAMKNPRITNALKIGASFGFFQALMPTIGWLGGTSMTGLISGIDHWIAFWLLCLIGARMIFEAFREKHREEKADTMNGHVLMTLSVATSIDALAVGVSLAFLETPIAGPVMVFGTVTFLVSFLGVYVGSKLGRFLGNKAEAFGGLILIGIGVRILLEDLL